MGQNKDSLVSAGKMKRHTNNLSDGGMKMASRRAMTRESPSHGYLPQSRLPSGLLLNMLHTLEYPFGQLQSIFPAVCPSSFLLTSSIQLLWQYGEKKGGLHAVQALLSNIQSTGAVNSVSSTNPNHSG